MIKSYNYTNESLDGIISSVGSFRRLILHPEQIPQSNEIESSCSSEYAKITESNIKRRKLTFNEEALSVEFVDQQRWKTGLLYNDILLHSCIPIMFSAKYFQVVIVTIYILITIDLRLGSIYSD